MTLRESPFFRFFRDERVRSVRCLNDVLFFHDAGKRDRSDSFDFYLGTQPWGEWYKRDAVTGGAPWGHHYDEVEDAQTRDLYGYRNNPWYEPGDEFTLSLEWDKTIELYRSLKRGYRPSLYGTYPEAVLLMRSDGEMRVVVAQGQHRMAVLSQLGYKSVSMVITRASMGTIHEEDAEKWHFVRNKLCTKKQALLIFYAFFELNGRERAKYLQLPISY